MAYLALSKGFYRERPGTEIHHTPEPAPQELWQKNPARYGNPAGDISRPEGELRLSWNVYEIRPYLRFNMEQVRYRLFLPDNGSGPLDQD
uniref:Uncharacterized protein n=1 Tax=Leptospirillum ferriphilum TaxID=178606 RepID=A0A7C3R4P5_9BACT